MKKTFFIAFAFIAVITTTGFDQVFKTSLKITVLNDLGNLEEGATVTLYSTEEDYKKEQNPVAEAQVTDKKGVVKFKELEPKVYYVLANKGDKNNWGMGVQTDKLEDGKLNKINVVIN